MAYKVIVSNYETDLNTLTNIAATISIIDTSLNQVIGGFSVVDLTTSVITNAAALRAEATTEIVAYMIGQGLSITAGDIIFPEDSTVIPTPSSYQTIISQTGTSAPAVTGGFAPINTYSGSPTFTWARTSAGVYTLTASSAIFNTSGKTSVFMTPPSNLNGSFRGVVTSSTVITFTTAVQSLAVLGLLGFTTTPTDAMLSNTMIYVQTYP